MKRLSDHPAYAAFSDTAKRVIDDLPTERLLAYADELETLDDCDLWFLDELRVAADTYEISGWLFGIHYGDFPCVPEAMRVTARELLIAIGASELMYDDYASDDEKQRQYLLTVEPTFDDALNPMYLVTLTQQASNPSYYDVSYVRNVTTVDEIDAFLRLYGCVRASAYARWHDGTRSAIVIRANTLTSKGDVK